MLPKNGSPFGPGKSAKAIAIGFIQGHQENVRKWRRTYVPTRLASGSYLGHSGKHMLVASLSQADPKPSSLHLRNSPIGARPDAV